MHAKPIARHRWLPLMLLAVLLTAGVGATARQAWADTTADRVLGQLAFPYNGANLVLSLIHI